MAGERRTAVWTDITDEFSFIDEGLEYHDGPLQGLLRSKSGGEVYAFQCAPIVWDLLWHWIVIPLESEQTDLAAAFARAAKQAGTWISIVEDRRAGKARLEAVWLDSRVPRVVPI